MTAPSPDSGYDIFLSYASRDERYARRFLHALRSEGISAFTARDVRPTAWGQDVATWFGEIGAHAAAVMFLVSKHFSKSASCLNELAALREVYDSSQRPAMLPVRLDDAPLPDHLLDFFVLDFRQGGAKHIANVARTKVDELRISGPVTTTLPTSTLAARMAEGDAEAFSAFVERVAPRALLLAYRVTHDRDWADDIVQEAFVRLFTRMPSLSHDTSLEQLLYRSVTNTSIDMLRRRTRPRATEDVAPTIETVRRELNSLDEEDRKIISLHAIDGLPLSEVANILGQSESLTADKYHRAIRWLRRATAKVDG